MHWKQRIFDRVQQLLGKEQAFCFLIAQHKLIKASQEQASGKIASRQTNVNVEIGLAIQRGFADWKLFQPRPANKNQVLILLNSKFCIGRIGAFKPSRSASLF